MPPRFIARQLSRPTGFFGRIMGRLMNRHNAKLNSYAVRQLELTPSDRVLEVGFGGGVSLPALIAGAAFVGGVDRSSDMVRRAKAMFSEAVSAGRADFREGNVEELPFEASSFGKVCTVNTVYFWSSLDAGSPKSIGCFRRAGVWSSASFRRSGWTEWECQRTSSHRERPRTLSPRSGRQASRTCASSDPSRPRRGTSSSRPAE